MHQTHWRHDRITNEWREEHKEELALPLDRLTPIFLGEAVTYCLDGVIGNPFAEELIRQAGFIEEYNKTYLRKDKIRVFDKACRFFGFRVC